MVTLFLLAEAGKVCSCLPCLRMIYHSGISGWMNTHNSCYDLNMSDLSHSWFKIYPYLYPQMFAGLKYYWNLVDRKYPGYLCYVNCLSYFIFQILPDTKSMLLISEEIRIFHHTFKLLVTYLSQLYVIRGLIFFWYQVKFMGWEWNSSCFSDNLQIILQ